MVYSKEKSMAEIEELLTRGVANIISGKEALKKALESGKKLNVYLGIDATATRIHVGHAVPLRKLQAFAERGHHVTFLIGDFTALIGDTSDKDTERPVLTPEQIHENFQTYKKQAEKLLDFSKVTVLHNSDWLKKLTFEEIVKLCQHFSVGDFVGRELIKRRLTESKRVGLHEFLYPVMQGYDSYHMDTDIQLGGTDQTFNMQAGRTLQKDLRGKESFVISTEFLIGTDGRKMSKSWGNAIWLEDEPDDMYRKVMAVNDNVIVNYYTLATNVPMKRIEEIKKELEHTENPMQIKKALAHQIVSELHNINAADAAAEDFEKTVQKKEIPNQIPEFSISSSVHVIAAEDLLVKAGLAESKTQAKRLIQQGGVTIDNEKILAPDDEIGLDDDVIVKVGKTKFVRVKKEE